MATPIYSAMKHLQRVPMADLQATLDAQAALGFRLVEVDDNVIQRTGLDGASHLYSLFVATVTGEAAYDADTHRVYYNVAEEDVQAILDAECLAGRALIQRILRFSYDGASVKHDLFFVGAVAAGN